MVSGSDTTRANNGRALRADLNKDYARDWLVYEDRAWFSRLLKSSSDRYTYVREFDPVFGL